MMPAKKVTYYTRPVNGSFTEYLWYIAHGTTSFLYKIPILSLILSNLNQLGKYPCSHGQGLAMVHLAINLG